MPFASIIVQILSSNVFYISLSISLLFGQVLVIIEGFKLAFWGAVKWSLPNLNWQNFFDDINKIV